MDEEAWLDRLEREVDNLRTALRWASEAGEVELGLRMAARLLPLWERRGDLREGVSWLDGWLQTSRRVAPEVRAQALYARAVLAFRLGDYGAATASGEASLALYRKLGDRSGMAAALNYLAGVEWEHGDLDRAIERCEESLALRRQLASPYGVAASLTNLGLLLHERKEPRAVELQEEAVSIYRAIGDRGANMVWGLNSLADIALGEGRLDAARAYLDECLAIIGGGRYPVLTSNVLNTRGHLARAEGDLAAAGAWYHEALRI